MPLASDAAGRFPVATLARTSCIAQKLLAHADRGRDDSTHARDLVDLAFMAARWAPEHAASAMTIAEGAYGAVVARELDDGLSRFEDSAHRRRSVEALAITDTRTLARGLTALRKLLRSGSVERERARDTEA